MSHEELEALVLKIAKHLGMTVLSGPIPTIFEVIEETASHYSLEPHDLLSKNRRTDITRARQIGMYIAQLVTKESTVQIGIGFGGRDHTTVIHAKRRITIHRQMEIELDQDIEAIIYKLILRHDARIASSGAAAPPPLDHAAAVPSLSQEVA